MANADESCIIERKIKEQKPQIRIILATSTAEAAWEDDAREIGVESFWYKEYSEESLSEVIERTIAGEHVYPHNPVDIKLGNTNRVELSDRELDVLRELTSAILTKRSPRSCAFRRTQFALIFRTY